MFPDIFNNDVCIYQLVASLAIWRDEQGRFYVTSTALDHFCRRDFLSPMYRAILSIRVGKLRFRVYINVNSCVQSQREIAGAYLWRL